MIADAIAQLIRDLDPASLGCLRTTLHTILDSRERAAANDLIAWHSFSSLELAGIIAMLDARLLAAPDQSLPSLSPHRPGGGGSASLPSAPRYNGRRGLTRCRRKGTP